MATAGDLEREADHNGYGLLIRAGYSGGDAMVESSGNARREAGVRAGRPVLEDASQTAGTDRISEGADENGECLESTGDAGELLFRPIFRRDPLQRSARSRQPAGADGGGPGGAPGGSQAGRCRGLTRCWPTLIAIWAPRPCGPEGEELKGSGKKDNRNWILKRTAEEVSRKSSMLRPKGQAALAENRSKAESLYREAIKDAPQLGDPHRGIGMLYEDESKKVEAERRNTAEYLKLKPLPNASDRPRIARRLEKLTNPLACWLILGSLNTEKKMNRRQITFALIDSDGREQRSRVLSTELLRRYATPERVRSGGCAWSRSTLNWTVSA